MLFFNRFLFLGLSCLLIIQSCKTSHLRKDGNDIQTVLLDTLEIIRSKDDLYKGSETLINDMVHTKLSVRFDWEKQYLYGTATLTLKPHFYPTQNLTLDAKGMEILKVSLANGTPLNYTYDTAQLFITLDKSYTASEPYTVVIDYIAKPNDRVAGGSRAISSDKGLYFINPLKKEVNKPQQIWTQGETESSSGWFPCIDKPNQKMTQEIEITIDKKFETLSNGLKTKSISNSDGTRTDVWKMDQQHVPYLAMMAIGEFAVIKDSWNGKEVNYYVEPKYKDVASKIFGNTPEMIDFYSKTLGVQYPWPKYAQVVVRDYVSGAMENTSATIHGEFVQRNERQLIDESHQDIIAHELFHQWFGDLVTCESWSNLPLNESFATYGEYLWNEHKYGNLYADVKLYRQAKGYFSESKRKNVHMIRHYYDDKEDMFDAHSYNKGGAILHMLRSQVGDEAFFASLQKYLTKKAFGTAEIHDLRLAFEEVTGRDMNKFFNQWFLQSGHPVLDIKYSSDEDSVYVDITQKHNADLGQVYNLPMKINVFYGDIVMTYPVVYKYVKQRFSFPALGFPDLVDIDAERVLLCEKKENKTLKQFAFQLAHNTRYATRVEALDGLKDSIGKNEIATQAYRSLLDATEWIWRREAIRKMRSDSLTQTVFLEKIKEMATADTSAQVRKEALDFLVATKRKDLQPIFEKAIIDESYRCVANGLEGVEITDTLASTSFAKALLLEDDSEVKNQAYEVLSKRYDADLAKVFQQQLLKETGYVRYALFFHYANYLCHSDSALVFEGVNYLHQLWQNEQNKDNSKTIARAIQRVSDYLQKRSDAPFKDDAKKLAGDLISTMKTEKE
jgi:aminopeptidase N